MNDIDVMRIIELYMQNIRRMATFEKVSYEQWKKDVSEYFDNENDIEEAYANIKLPKRATVGSAGYDLFNPLYKITLNQGETIKIPTGIRCKMDCDWALALYPRSGLGFKYRLQLDNSTGWVDADYYNSDNEGHIFIKITNDSKQPKTCEIPYGSAFAQGIFTMYGLTIDDDADGIRNGGFGSTSK
jgi:dUTP pyrophosphatase